MFELVENALNFAENIVDYLKKKRSEKIASWIGTHLNSGEKVVDIGAGDCFLSHSLQQRCGIEVFPVDIADYGRTDLKTIIYDGKTLPFPDDYFDSALVLFVLHYVKDPPTVLREARRVARKKIIILQDICPSPAAVAPTLVWGYLANLGRHSDRKLPYALSSTQMKNFLNLLGLKITTEKKFVSSVSLYLITHQLLVVEKTRISISPRDGKGLEIFSDGYIRH